MLVPIIISTDAASGVQDVQAWLDFNNFDYLQQSFWDINSAKFVLDLKVKNHIVVWHHTLLQQFLVDRDCMNDLIHFLEQRNHLWIVGMDTALVAIELHYQQKLQSLDLSLPNKNITFFLDAQPLANCYLNNLTNITIKTMKYNFFFKSQPRVQAATSVKHKPKFDYMLTSLDKPNRPHRTLLWKQLNQRPGLLDKGQVSFRKPYASGWLGTTNRTNPWKDGHASMDLYLSCAIELVPETCHDQLLFVTEKTYKPLMTSTPFILVSSPGYLRYLHSLGFETFSSVIDEQYDTCEALDSRVTQCVDALEKVCEDSMAVYQASVPILEHNFARLCEIAGSWYHEFDQMMWAAFEECQNK